jgi:hypothetical protein
MHGKVLSLKTFRLQNVLLAKRLGILATPSVGVGVS